MDIGNASPMQLLKQIDDFCEANGIAQSSFGRLALGDGSLIADLRDGREPTLRVVRRVLKFMAEYRPESAAA